MEQEAILASQSWVNAGGMILLSIGISFLVLEFFLPSFGLFGFTGASSVLIGIVQLHQTGYIEDMPVSIEALIIAAIIALLLALAGGYFTFKLYKKKSTTGVEAMIGAEATIIEWKEQLGRVQIMGEQWQAYSDDSYNLKPDDKVTVSKINGLKIKISYVFSDE